MKKTGRLEDVKNQLTPLQIVLLDVETARHHGSMEGFARALLAGSAKAVRAETVEEAIRAAHRGQPEQEVRERLRAAKKEVMFLFRLAVETWSSIASNERAWHLTSAAIGLLHVIVLDAVRSGVESDESLESLVGSWHTAARGHLIELLAELEAAKLIEHEYFAGAPITLQRDDDVLNELITTARTETELTSKLKSLLDDDQAGSKDSIAAKALHNLAHEAHQRAVELANARADLARIQTLEWCGESAKATAYVLDHLPEHP